MSDLQSFYFYLFDIHDLPTCFPIPALRVEETLHHDVVYLCIHRWQVTTWFQGFEIPGHGLFMDIYLSSDRTHLLIRSRDSSGQIMHGTETCSCMTFKSYTRDWNCDGISRCIYIHECRMLTAISDVDSSSRQYPFRLNQHSDSFVPSGESRVIHQSKEGSIKDG